ncbi:unnamed protein product [Oikopleura dioica]|uniref:Uncharacterized protein n=1 Tax=Oikopleura dioica TaxID=34765 RepID=E4XUW4_OIKDI|nr:unnamed protein product [Oikopleura dioica]
MSDFLKVNFSMERFRNAIPKSILPQCSECESEFCFTERPPYRCTMQNCGEHYCKACAGERGWECRKCGDPSSVGGSSLQGISRGDITPIEALVARLTKAGQDLHRAVKIQHESMDQIKEAVRLNAAKMNIMTTKGGQGLYGYNLKQQDLLRVGSSESQWGRKATETQAEQQGGKPIHQYNINTYQKGAENVDPGTNRTWATESCTKGAERMSVAGQPKTRIVSIQEIDENGTNTSPIHQIRKYGPEQSSPSPPRKRVRNPTKAQADRREEPVIPGSQMWTEDNAENMTPPFIRPKGMRKRANKRQNNLDDSGI